MVCFTEETKRMWGEEERTWCSTYNAYTCMKTTWVNYNRPPHLMKWLTGPTFHHQSCQSRNPLLSFLTVMRYPREFTNFLSHPAFFLHCLNGDSCSPSPWGLEMPSYGLPWASSLNTGVLPPRLIIIRLKQNSLKSWSLLPAASTLKTQFSSRNQSPWKFTLTRGFSKALRRPVHRASTALPHFIWS